LEAKGSTLEYFGGEGRIAFSALRPNDRTPFAVLMIEAPPNLGYFMDPGQVVPLYAAGAKGSNGEELLDLGFDSGQTSNVTDRALGIFRGAYGSKVKKEDIFFYVYGLLHSPDYRQAYAADLTKLLPRIPLVEDLWPFVEAGHDLSEIHLGYENATPYPLEGLDAEPVGDSYSFFRTEKMAYAKVRVKGELLSDRSAIVYSSKITLNGIPDGAHRYMLGSRSAIGWIMDRYQVKRDKESGIVNDPNDWSKEVGDPRYILDLLARIVTVSLETMTIVDALPALSIRANQSGAS
jgi:predicted helicase